MKNRKANRKRSWPVTLLGILLLLQSAGLFIVGEFNLSLSENQWGLNPPDIHDAISDGLTGWAFFSLAFLALLAAAGFFRLWPMGWLLAVALQGLSLAIAIELYFRAKPYYVYPVMIFCAFMVGYLNHYDVQIAFQNERSLKDWEGIGER